MKMKRREFLTKSIAGAGGLLFGSGYINAVTQESAIFDPYKKIREEKPQDR